MFIKATVDMIHNIYKVIEENKEPYLFTKQTGDKLDSTGAFFNIARLDGESDENYKFRIFNWNLSNMSSNTTAINNACKTLNHSKAANYVPYTKGIGTGTIYLIPKEYDKENIDLAINEAVEKVSTVICPSSRVEFTVPTPINVKLVAYLDVKENSDVETIKRNIETNIKNYINSIVPGDKLYLGEINNKGLDEEGVQYFNVVQIYLNDKEETDFEILQTIEAKFLYDQLIWWDVEN